MDINVTIPKFITREFIRQHKELTFVYGDTLYHDGYGKQANIARGEPNAYPIPTKKWRCANDSTSFFSDAQFELFNKVKIDEAISRIPRDKPIIVFPKIGEGWSKMPEKCPKTYAYLMQQLKNYANPKR